jgi:hypothetical protein
MSTEKSGTIQKKVLDALSLSIAHVTESISSNKIPMKYELTWQAYSQVEMAIALSKLGFKEQIGLALGTFRNLGKLKTSRGANQDMKEVLNLNLRNSRKHLEQALAEFTQGKAIEGLESARKARDILKLILLQEKRMRRVKREKRD